MEMEGVEEVCEEQRKIRVARVEHERECGAQDQAGEVRSQEPGDMGS